MSDGTIKIIVGASADRSIETVFGGMEKRAQKAGQNIAKEMSAGMGVGSTNGTRNPFNQMAKDADKAAKEATRVLEAQFKAANKYAKEEQKAYEASAKARVKAETEASKSIVAEFKSQTRERAKELKTQQQEEERASKKMDDSREKFSKRASKYALRSAGQMFGAAERFGSDMLHGAGVDTSIGSLVKRTVGIENAAVDLSNRGHIEGAAGPNGGVVSSKILEGEARKTGLANAVNPEDILSAGRTFVGITGDLNLWRKIMPQVVKQTMAMGGSQEDAAKMAGEFAAHVGDIPKKEEAIMHMMLVGAGQGKIGGIDSTEFAKYASRVASPAGQFAGDKSENVGKLTAIAEIAKIHGGAKDAAEAMGSITQFSNTLKKVARTKAIASLIDKKNGQFTDDQHSNMRGINEIMKDLIWGAAKDVHNPKGPRVKADLTAIAKATGDVRGAKALYGLVDTFNSAGGGTKGMDAVDAELKKFDSAIMSTTEMERAAAEKMATTQAQTEVFNQQLEAISHGVMAELGPAMRDLAPKALSAAQGLGSMASWAARNPWGAVGVGVGAAVSKGLMESALRSSMEDLTNGSGRAAISMGALGLAVAGAILAMHQIDKDIAEKEEGQRKDSLDNANAGILEGKAAAHAKDGKFTPEDQDNLNAINANLYTRIANVNKLKQSNPDYAKDGAGTLAYEAAFDPDKAAARQDAGHIDELKNELENNRRVLTSGLKVYLMNPEDIKGFGAGPSVPGAGRSPDPGSPKLPDRWK